MTQNITLDTTHLNERYLVTVADDLGRSSSVNQAIAEAHDRGIITAASLMAGGEAFQEAVQIVRERSQLSVGLHVTLCDGRAVLPPSYIPDLVDPDGYLKESPIVAGLRYTNPRILSQIAAEVEAQFNRLEEMGIHPTHVDGHHHLHMHPVIFEVICRQASRRGVRWIRLPKESLSAVFSVRSRGMIPFVEWAAFRLLGLYNIRKVRRYGLCVSCHVYGLSRTGSIDEKYLLDIVKRADGSFNEIFTHPDIATDCGRKELEALTSTRVRNQLACLGISLVGYKELSEMAMALDAAAGKK
jgi:hopanoid biosynthesis associated protein HpnK